MRLFYKIPIKLSDNVILETLEQNSFSVRPSIRYENYEFLIDMEYSGWKETLCFVPGETYINKVKELNYLGLDGNPVSYDTKLKISNEFPIMIKDIQKIIDFRQTIQ